MDRYKYSVTPFSPIKELIPGKSIRAPFSADLSKDEVFMCMKHCPVYRLFPGKEPIRVTGSNFESLHVKVFKEEQEVKPIVEPVKVAAPIVEEKVEEVPVEKDIKILDKQELKDNFTVESSVVEEETAEKEDIEVVDEEPTEVGVELGAPEQVEVEVEEPSVEGYSESEDESVEEEVDEDEIEEVGEESSPVVEESHNNYKPQYKPNYNGYSKKNKKNKNRNN